MNAKYTLIVDFARPTKSNTVLVSEGDANSRLVEFILLNNKEIYSLADAESVTVRGIREDGSTIVGAGEIKSDEYGHKLNVINYLLPAEITEISGKIIMTVTILDQNGSALSSFEFYIQVRNALYNENDGAISEQDLSGFRDLAQQTKRYLEEMRELAMHVTELPNPYQLRIVLDNVEYNYTGRFEENLELGYLARIEMNEEAHPEESIDETSARIAVNARNEAVAAKNIAVQKEATVSRNVQRILDSTEAAVSAGIFARQAADAATAINQQVINYEESARKSADSAREYANIAAGQDVVRFSALMEPFRVGDEVLIDHTFQNVGDVCSLTFSTPIYATGKFNVFGQYEIPEEENEYGSSTFRIDRVELYNEYGEIFAGFSPTWSSLGMDFEINENMARQGVSEIRIYTVLTYTYTNFIKLTGKFNKTVTVDMDFEKFSFPGRTEKGSIVYYSTGTEKWKKSAAGQIGKLIAYGNDYNPCSSFHPIGLNGVWFKITDVSGMSTLTMNRNVMVDLDSDDPIEMAKAYLFNNPNADCMTRVFTDQMGESPNTVTVSFAAVQGEETNSLTISVSISFNLARAGREILINMVPVTEVPLILAASV